MLASTFLNPTVAVMAAKVPEGGMVADFGAGSGFFTRAAARAAGPQGVVWAVDLNREILSRIKNLAAADGLHNVEVVHGDISSLGGSNLPDSRFDFVIAANVLFAVEYKAALVEEVWRVLKPGGKALVIDWKDSFGGLGPHPDHVVAEGKAHELFLKHKFNFIERVPAGAYHWGFVVRKKVR